MNDFFQNFVIQIKKGVSVSELQDFLREHEFDLMDYKFTQDIELSVSADLSLGRDFREEVGNGIIKVCR